eukprot:14254788-Heterocapsa_arctica.AAC.1
MSSLAPPWRHWYITVSGRLRLATTSFQTWRTRLWESGSCAAGHLAQGWPQPLRMVADHRVVVGLRLGHVSPIVVGQGQGPEREAGVRATH